MFPHGAFYSPSTCWILDNITRLFGSVFTLKAKQTRHNICFCVDVYVRVVREEEKKQGHTHPVVAAYLPSADFILGGNSGGYHHRLLGDLISYGARQCPSFHTKS